MTGLEPAQPCDYKNLNLTRLPIPPHPHVVLVYPISVAKASIFAEFLKNFGDKFCSRYTQRTQRAAQRRRGIARQASLAPVCDDARQIVGDGKNLPQNPYKLARM